MNKMQLRTTARRIGDGLTDFGTDVVLGLRERYWNSIEEARLHERDANISTAAIAMLEIGGRDADVMRMLQKHYDLRQSEAAACVEWAHHRIEESA